MMPANELLHETAEAASMISGCRHHFPLLHQQINGKELVYLDNAATSQKPQVVIDLMMRYYVEENSNIHRGIHYLSERATQAYEQVRKKVRGFLNAGSEREIIFVRGTTEGINLVASSFGRKHVSSGDEVLISAMEHHSNIVPWQMLCEEKGASLKVIPMSDDGELLLGDPTHSGQSTPSGR
jgi:cysteine desulfurase/selenocysteine lyase